MRVVPPPGVLLATAPSAVVRLNVAAGASALRVGNQLVVSAVPIDLAPARAVVPLIPEIVRTAKAPASARVALAVRALARAQEAEALVSAVVDQSTEAPASVQVGLVVPALVSVQDAEALASELVDQSTEAPASARVGLVVPALASVRDAQVLANAQVALSTAVPVSAPVVLGAEALANAQAVALSA